MNAEKDSGRALRPASTDPRRFKPFPLQPDDWR